MNKLINLIICVLPLWLVGCKNKQDIEISPILMEKLELIIDKYQAHCEENLNIKPNPSVYIVDFREVKGDCFVLIGTDIVYYEAEMNGCLLYNDILISFQALNEDCNKFVDYNPSTKCQETSGFEKAFVGMGSYRSTNWIYKVVNDSLVIYDQKAFPVE